MKRVFLSIVLLLASARFLYCAEIQANDVCECTITKEIGNTYLVQFTLKKGTKFSGYGAAKFVISENKNVLLEHDIIIKKDDKGEHYGSTSISRELLLKSEISICFEYDGGNYVLIIRSVESKEGVIAPKLTLVEDRAVF